MTAASMVLRLALAPGLMLGAAACSADASAPSRTASQAIPPPPATRHDDVRETLHGVEVVDPYRWLEDQDAPETRAWIDAQNKYAHGLLDALPMRVQDGKLQVQYVSQEQATRT